MAGFCRRCGDIIRGSESRCKCGGTSASSQVTKAMFEPADGVPKPSDRWLKTYGERRSVSPATTVLSRSLGKPPPSQLHAHSPSLPLPSANTSPRRPRESLGDRSLNTLPTATVTPPTPFKPSDAAPPKEVKRGLSVKSSARAHVRSLTASMPDSVDLSAAEEEVLTNVFGSVLDPHETRGRCGACQDIFKREGKIFPDPRREDESGKWAGVFYCRKCYVERFSRGKCGACHHTIVGDEGYIQFGQSGSRGLWHKKCFKCLHCKADISNSPAVDLQGDPCCDDCFDKPPGRHTPLQASMVTDIPDLRVPRHGIKRLSVVSSPAAKMIKPAVEELRSKLRKAGIEAEPARLPTVPLSPAGRSSSALCTVHKSSAAMGKSKSAGQEPNPTASSPSVAGNSPLFNRPPFRTAASTTRMPRTPPRLLPALPRPHKTFGSASTQHVLSPAANPLCPTCKLPLFRPNPEPQEPGQRQSTADQLGGTLATLPTTGETFHVQCLTCDDCKQAFTQRKYVLLGAHKLCESCVAKRDLAEVQDRLRQLKQDLHQHDRPLNAPRSPQFTAPDSRLPNDVGAVRPSFPPAHPLAPVPLTNTRRADAVSTSSSTSALAQRFNKVSTSPFLGAQDGILRSPAMSASGGSPAKFGGQPICPGCSRPGTITETKPGPNNERWHVKCLKCVQCGKLLDSAAKRFDGSSDVGCRDCLGKAKAMKRASSYVPIR